MPYKATITDTLVYGSSACSISKDVQSNAIAANPFSSARVDAWPDPRLHADLVCSDATPRAIRLHKRLNGASNNKHVILLNCSGKPRLGSRTTQGPQEANGRCWHYRPALLANVGNGSELQAVFVEWKMQAPRPAGSRMLELLVNEGQHHSGSNTDRPVYTVTKGRRHRGHSEYSTQHRSGLVAAMPHVKFISCLLLAFFSDCARNIHSRRCVYVDV